jgi:hypothetical protein
MRQNKNKMSLGELAEGREKTIVSGQKSDFSLFFKKEDISVTQIIQEQM